MRTWLWTRAQLQLEILALRHQVMGLQRQRKARAPIAAFDRAFWVWLYRLWPGCVNALVIVKPETVVRWHRGRFSPVLEMEISHPPTRAAGDRSGHPQADRAHEPGEPVVGGCPSVIFHPDHQRLLAER